MRLAFLAPLTVENIATAQRLGYDGLVADGGWLDSSRLDVIERALPTLSDELARTQVKVTAVAIYGNTIGTPVAQAVEYYNRAIWLAQRLGAGVVSGITGRDNALSLEDNLALFAERFQPIADLAANAGVRVALEPWPGRVNGYGPYRWANLAVSPVMYDRLFELVPQPALGIEYDPSHYAWQGIDYLAVVRNYAKRLHHAHATDVLIDDELLKRGGVHAAGWWRACLPGLGQIDWPVLFDELAAAGYDGDIAVKQTDAAFTDEHYEEGLVLAVKTLRPLVESHAIATGGA